MIVFEHANNYQVEDYEFFAAWELWFDNFGNGLNALTDPLPRHNTIDPMISLETRQNKITGNTRKFSLEYLCRVLVPSSYRNTMQATNPFMAANNHLLSDTTSLSPYSNRIVYSAQLTEDGRGILKSCREQPGWEELKQLIESRLDSDIEVSDRNTGDTELIAVVGGDDDVVIIIEEEENSSTKTLLNGIDQHNLNIPVFNLNNFVQDFVTNVNNDPYQPTFRGTSYGGRILGWSNRLNNYFWPNPAINLTTTLTILTRINAPASGFMGAILHFPIASRGSLVNWANAIFKWGGVPQVFTYSNVLDVLSSVNACVQTKNARMNSGWTKVASFASEVLPPDQHLVIWDSRVAHSLVTRFETMLSSVGFIGLPVALNGIGYVRGRGGSRIGYHYNTTRWHNAYGRWDTVFKGSELVRLIRDELNSRSGNDFECPVNKGQWTVRLVEMVLFMDGY